MAYVKLDNFVNVVITQHTTPTANSSRDTVALFYYAASEPSEEFSDRCTTYTSSTYSGITDAKTKAYAKVFFDNGGKNLMVIKSYSTLIADDLELLDPTIIVVSLVEAGTAASTLAGIGNTYNTDHTGIYKKIFVSYALTNPTSSSTHQDYYVDKRVFSTTESSVTTVHTEACMSIAAYLCKIDFTKIDAVKDYCFTEEVYDGEDGYVTTDDEIVKACLTYNGNVTTKLAGKVVNIGGNDSNGNDLTNEYTLIVLTQTLTDVLVKLLLTKIKYDQYGAAKVLNLISAELDNYKTAGYISTAKTWTDADLVINNRTIITKGTPLVNGYIVTMDSFASLTTAQKTAHQLPNVYVVIADQYGIRKIVLTGEVF